MDKRQLKNWKRKLRKADSSRPPTMSYPHNGNMVTVVEGRGEKGIEFSKSNTTWARTQMIEQARKKG